LRDGYASIGFTRQLNTALRTDEKTNEFLRETKEGKKSMYDTLIKTLNKNTNTQYIADDIIYQQLIQQGTATGQTEEI
jgi:hypothetical protein